MNKQGKVKANKRKNVLVLNILARHSLNLCEIYPASCKTRLDNAKYQI